MLVVFQCAGLVLWFSVGSWKSSQSKKQSSEPHSSGEVAKLERIDHVAGGRLVLVLLLLLFLFVFPMYM